MRPRHSLCPPGQEFLPGRAGRLNPSHTKALGDNCRCGRCRAMRTWTPELRAAASDRMRTMARQPRKRPSIASRWTPQQEDALRALLGQGDTVWIAEQLTEKFGHPRTNTAVRERIKVLKLSRLTVRPWSRQEVARSLGVSYERVRDWVRAGLLTGTPWRLGGGHRPDAVSQVFTVADVERFLRAHTHLVHVGQVRHAGLRMLVQSLTRGRPLAPASSEQGRAG